VVSEESLGVGVKVKALVLTGDYVGIVWVHKITFHFALV